jgi:hypothetical protein
MVKKPRHLRRLVVFNPLLCRAGGNATQVAIRCMALLATTNANVATASRRECRQRRHNATVSVPHEKFIVAPQISMRKTQDCQRRLGVINV